MALKYHFGNIKTKKTSDSQPKGRTIGKTEWGKLWEKSFSTESEPSRLSKARSYLRQNRILSIELHNLTIKAHVEGSYTNYTVTVTLNNPYSPQQWHNYLTLLSQKSLYLAYFLNKEMPLDITTIFNDFLNPLFPRSIESASSFSCTCYDWVANCKHVLGVLYAFTELINDNPLLIFQLRGKSIGEIIEQIKLIRKQGNAPRAPEIEQFWSCETLSYSLPDLSPAKPINAYIYLGALDKHFTRKKLHTLFAPLYKQARERVRALRESSKE